MISPEGFAIRPRMPASWRICSREPRAPESAISRIGLNLAGLVLDGPASRGTSPRRPVSVDAMPDVDDLVVALAGGDDTAACAASRSPARPCRAPSRISSLVLGMSMSSMPKETPARVAKSKVTPLSSSSISTVFSLPRCW